MKKNKKIFLIALILIIVYLLIALFSAYVRLNYNFTELRNRLIAKVDNLGFTVVLTEDYANKISLLSNLINGIPIGQDYDSIGIDEKYSVIKSKVYVTQRDLIDSESNLKDWLMVNGNYKQNRFFSGDQINSDNVDKLRLKFTANTDIFAPIQSAPLVVNGVMYLSTAFNNVYAFSAVTGQIFWHFKYKNKKPKSCCGVNNRGLAIYKNRLYMATVDGNMLAIDARNGGLIWASKFVDEPDQNPTTAAPVIFNGKIFVGSSSNGKRGFITALNADSGKVEWRFFTIPDKGQEGEWATKDALGRVLNRNIEREKKMLASKNNLVDIGGGVWNTPAVDVKNNMLFFLVGDPQPMFQGDSRPGDNLYTNSLISLNASSGKKIWHFQFIPHDVLDLDFATNPILTTAIDNDGRSLNGIVTAGKVGYAFVNNIGNGKLIRFSSPFLSQEGFVNYDLKKVLEKTPNPISGVSWSPMSLDPGRGILYALVASNTESEKSGALVALEINSGKIKFQYKVDHPLVGGGPCD